MREEYLARQSGKLHNVKFRVWVADLRLSPASVEEVQEVLKIANEFDIPVWTFSRGKNLG